VRRRGRNVDGWLVLDKPYGMGSTTAVGRARRLFDAKKTGHGGTLDPLATGILPIAFGAATKTVPFVMDGAKIYAVTVRFGESRSTDDAEGDVVERSEARPTDAALRAVLPALTGDILQVPPAFSALKLEGRRAYDLARAGEEVVLAPRPARVDRFELVERPDADTAVFTVASGKGVYMRALARDLARAVGTVGYVAALRRRRCGPFREEDSISLDKLEGTPDNAHASPDLLLPIETALADIPALALTDEEAGGLAHGRALSAAMLANRIPGNLPSRDGLVCAMAGERVLALCRLEDGWLKPERILQRMGEHDDVDHGGTPHGGHR
jgi:tRNA pseudouridine55 synthase